MNRQRKSRPIIITCAILLIAALLVVGLFVCAILRACSEIGKPRPSGPSPLITPSATVSGEGTLIFQSSRDGNSEIYRVQADGTGLVNLTNDPGDDVFAVWSPDGQQIAFNSDRNGQWGLYVMNAGGPNPRFLYGLEEPGWAAWSPDGKWIALSSDLMINADGSGERPVVAGDGEPCSTRPVWSPDGTQFACEINYRNRTEIAVRNFDLGQTTYLRAFLFNEFPAWSPDGTRIAFWGWETGFANSGHIYAANPDGSGLTELTDPTRKSGAPVWSPDGTRVANIALKCEGFLDCGSLEIWVVNADGTGEIQLTYNDLEETELVWSPDGARIAFAASPVQTATPGPGQSASPTDLFIINADGSAQIQLIVNDSGAGGLSWQPIVP